MGGKDCKLSTENESKAAAGTLNLVKSADVCRISSSRRLSESGNGVYSITHAWLSIRILKLHENLYMTVPKVKRENVGNTMYEIFYNFYEVYP